jgi:hypothetical protein
LLILCDVHGVISPTGDVLKATISQNDLSFVNKLGVGAFGDVWEVFDLISFPHIFVDGN